MSPSTPTGPALRARAPRRAVPRRAHPDQGSERDRRPAHDVLVQGIRRPRAGTDAAVVRRIRDAGFVIIGKTNTPEFGSIGMTESELNGDCRNPWDVSRTPGGSSGGAAAAVAAGLAPVAHGSDGGGSIRIPASCCNLFGIKPSRGRVSPAPYGSGSLGLGTSGPIARTVRDAAALLDVMSGYEPGDFYVAPTPERPFLAEADEAPGRLRIAVTTEPPIDMPVDPVVRRSGTRGGRAPERARPRRRRGDAAVAKRRRDRAVHAHLADRAGGLRRRRPLAARTAQPDARGARSQDGEPRGGGRGDAAPGPDAPDHRVLGRRRRRRHADARAPPGADRLDLGRRGRRPGGRVLTAVRSGRPSRRSSTSPASPRRRCRSTGARTACRSACR